LSVCIAGAPSRRPQRLDHLSSRQRPLNALLRAIVVRVIDRHGRRGGIRCARRLPHARMERAIRSARHRQEGMRMKGGCSGRGTSHGREPVGWCAPTPTSPGGAEGLSADHAATCHSSRVGLLSMQTRTMVSRSGGVLRATSSRFHELSIHAIDPSPGACANSARAYHGLTPIYVPSPLAGMFNAPTFIPSAPPAPKSFMAYAPHVHHDDPRLWTRRTSIITQSRSVHHGGGVANLHPQLDAHRQRPSSCAELEGVTVRASVT
jgi:hypothetical protein